MQIRSALTRNRWIPGAVALVLSVATGVSVLGTLPASATAPCVAHANSGEEQQWLQLHNTWRNQYIPGADPSNPLAVSSTLNAAAAGYATYLAEHPGAAGHAADGAESPPWTTRAELCGYPAGVAVGGEMISLVTNPTGPVTPEQALANMTLGIAGVVRVPAYVDGLPMKCIGVAHATSADGHRDAWVAVIMSADGACPQTVVVPTATPTGSSGFPTRTATPTRTPTPKATATKAPATAVFRLRMQAVASDGAD